MTCYSKLTFPLLKLPYLPFDLIIEQMKIGEIMLMSICSKRLAYLVKIGRYRMNDVVVHLKTEDLQIEINRTPQDSCAFCFNWKENRGLVPKESDSLSQWYQNGNSDVLNFIATDSFDDVITVSNRVRSDFRVRLFYWKLFPEELKDRNLKELISTLDFDTGYGVYLMNGVLDTETLSFLIDRMTSQKKRKKIVITAEIPTNFNHPRALDFATVECEDARWMTINDLKTIRDGSHVDLTGRTNFDNHDINQLIHYWTECKELTFAQIKIKLRDGVEIDELAIINGAITMFSHWHKRHYFLSKKLIQTHWVGSVEFVDGIVILTSWIFNTVPADTVTMLQLLDLRSDLAKGYSELIKKEREFRASFEEGENELRQEIARIKAEKKNVEIKFYETVDKLEVLGVSGFETSLEPDV